MISCSQVHVQGTEAEQGWSTTRGRWWSISGKHTSVDLPEGVTIFLHTYASARLQTTDGGKQLSLWIVAKELGHKNVSRVEDTYGHPSHYRPRGVVVEYRLG